jgi:hypothetical protein
VGAAEVAARSVNFLFLDDYFLFGDAGGVVTAVVVVAVAEERGAVDGVSNAFT